MTVKKHYDLHLGNVYSWMCGNFADRASDFKNFLTDNSVYPQSSGIAVDLGAGHGIQSVPLAELGFKVVAIDFNEQLLSELKTNSNGLHIAAIHSDIRNFEKFTGQPELITCCGDTLSHLDSKDEMNQLIAGISNTLCKNGKLILSFRDYTREMKETNRFIPVKSDENRIMTCMLDYDTDFVRVTDLLYEKRENDWQFSVSAYKKVRVKKVDVVNILDACNLSVIFNKVIHRLTTIIAVK
jgi:hypothetical protein